MSSAILDRTLPILDRLVSFDTTSRLSNLALIDDVECYLQAHGVTCRRLPNQAGDKANLWATIGPDRDGGIVLSGHTDVVPVDGQSWRTDPFRLHRDGDRFYGRGTSDMKSFLALVLAAVPDFVQHATVRPIHLAFSYDEEVGCFGAPGLIRSIADQGRTPLCVVVGEPTDMRIVNGHKGMYLCEVVVRGQEAHSSLVQDGVSAIMESLSLLQVLAETAKLEEQAHCDARFSPPWSTLTVGTIAGGTAANILAKECRFTFDLRAVPGRRPDVVLARFHDAVATLDRDLQARAPGTSVTLQHIADIPALAAEPNGAAERVALQLTGANHPGTSVSYASEAGQFQQAGFSTVLCGPGSITEAHKPDEFVRLQQLELGAAFMQRLAAFVHDARGDSPAIAV